MSTGSVCIFVISKTRSLANNHPFVQIEIVKRDKLILGALYMHDYILSTNSITYLNFVMENVGRLMLHLSLLLIIVVNLFHNSLESTTT